jgi:hypothetical protein
MISIACRLKENSQYKYIYAGGFLNIAPLQTIRNYFLNFQIISDGEMVWTKVVVFEKIYTFVVVDYFFISNHLGSKIMF